MSDRRRGEIVGLTGLTGAGKSFVARSIAEKTGAAIVDCDLIAREVVEPGSPVLDKLAEHFGGDIVKDGVLDRALLASRAFADPASTELLNSLTHPEIIRLTLERAEQLAETHDTVLIDAPQLFESGLDRYCDRIVAVVAPKKTRLRRIMERDGLTREEALRRMSRQLDEEEIVRRSDEVIENP